MKLEAVKKLVFAALVAAPLASVEAQPAPPGPPGVAPAISKNAIWALNPSEMRAQAIGHRVGIDAEAARLAGLVEAARRDRDVIRYNCLNDKLLQVKAQGAAVRASIEALETAIGKGDVEGRVAAFERISHARQVVHLAAAESEECIGADLTTTSSVRVEVTTTGNIPVEDSVTQPKLPTALPQRPPAASPSY